MIQGIRWRHSLLADLYRAPHVIPVLLLTLLPFTAAAHHSFSMFDLKKRITLEGVVTQFIWSNPHSFIELDVPGAGGSVAHYSIEAASPNMLVRYGWKFNSLKAGDKVKLVMFPRRNGENGGLLRTVVLPDGRTCQSGIDADEKGTLNDQVDDRC